MARQSGLARPREFDLDDAVRDAMHVFWDSGYKGASLPELSGGTGQSMGSLYKAFGDKQGLLLAALDMYMTSGLKATADLLSGSDTAKEAVRASLLCHAALSSGDAGRCGCLVVFMATETAMHDAEIEGRTGCMFRRLQQL
jgi:TetR/AcrR family transcriptional repressor of nem operon